MSTHIHHILPRHMGGSNDPSNLIELTVAEHADAHRVLYETHGHWQDLLAWRALSGQINSDEIRRLKTVLAWTGRKHSDEAKAKIRDARSKQKSNGWRWSDESREKQSRRHSGKKLSLEHRTAIGNAQRGIRQPEHTCPHCGKIGRGSAMKQWHFDNCKERT